MNYIAKKTLSIVLAAIGILVSIFSLWISLQYRTLTSGFLAWLASIRGVLLITGILFIILGMYFYPTKKHRTIINILFLLPAVLAFTMTVIIPFILGVFYSFTDWNGIKLNNFIGFENYKDFFKSPEYIHSFMATLIFTILNMLLVNIIAFGLSLLVTSKVRGRNIYRAGFFIPNLIGGIVLGYIWQFIFNYVITDIAAATNIKLLSQSLLALPDGAILAIIIVSTWQYAGYIMMIYVTAIQGVPVSVIEAAKMDGAHGFKRITKIIAPLIANSFTICIFLTLVNSFKQFDLNYAITNGGPSKLFMGKAIHSTELLALNIYKTAFTRNDMAVAQAKAVVFFVLLAIVSLIQVYVSKKKEVEM
jgi:raffinose/stachyose/melibiose transport system permease protein